MWILTYILSIAVANIITSAFAPVKLFVFLVPTGTFVIGLTLLFRNMVQMKHGRRGVYFAILIGLVISAGSSRILGSSLDITVASAVSFIISETLDTEVFSRLRRRSIYVRIVSGGVVGSLFDSGVFVTVGLSPLGADLVQWRYVPLAICGQFLVKGIMQGLGGIGVAKLIKGRGVESSSAADSLAQEL